MAQFLSTSITGSLTLSGSTTPITLPGTNARIEVGDPNGTDYSMNFRSNRYYYFQDNKVLYVQGTIIARNGIMDDGGPLALGHKSANIMYLSGSSVGIGTSTPIHDLHVNGDRLVFTQTGQTYTDGSTGLTGIGIRNTGTSAAYNAFGIQTGAGQAFQVRNNGDVRILRDLTVSGIVTAQEFHTEFVSASIVFSSGSTKFGNTVDDDHNFTGSLNVLAQSGASGLDIKRDANTYMNLNNSSTRNEFNFKSTTGLRFFHGSDSTSPLFISSSGNVGIGTTAPSQTLDVNGTALVRSGMYVANWIQNWGDGGTGLYFETDKVSLRTNGGTQQLVVSGSNGFVGIGTSTPARRLHIGGTGGSSGGIMLSPSSGDIEVQFQDSGTTNAYITLKDGTQQMRFRDDSANVLNVDFGTERVGIMTTAPTVALQIEGDVSASGYLKGDTLYALNDVVVADQILHYGDTDTNISFTDDQIVLNAGNVEFIRLSEGLTDQLVINEGGAALDVRIEGDGDTNLIRTDAANDRVGIGIASPTEKLHVYHATTNILSYLQSGDVDTILAMSDTGGSVRIQNTNGNLRLLTGGTASTSGANTSEALRVDTSGNVGIGVASPTHRLHVSGTYDVVKIEGSGSANSSSLFEVHGNNGLLFAIDDDLSDSLFSVNTIAGLPVIEAFSDNRVVMGAYNQNDFVISGSRVGIKTDIPEAELHISGATPQLFVGKMTGGSNNDGIYDDDHIVVGEGGSISIGAERRGDYAKQATTATGTTFRSRLNIWSDNQDHITFGGAHTHMVSAWEEWYTWINNDSANAGTFHLYHTNAKTEFARFTGGTGDGWYNGGDFGFGTTNPTHKLTVIGHVSASAFSGSFKGDGSGLQNVTATVSLAEVLGTGNDAGGSDIENVGALEAVTLNASGTISGSKLYFDPGTNAAPGLAFGNDTNTGIFGNNDSTVRFTINGSEKVRVNTNGLGLLSSTMYLTSQYKINFDYGVTNDYFVRKNSSNLEVYSAGNVAIGAGSATKLFVSQSGDVGIGTTSPSAKLQVAGNVVATSFTGSLLGTATSALTANDADTLDTLQATSFLRSDANDTGTGIITLSNDNTSGSLVIQRASNTDQKLYLRGGKGSGEAWVAAQYQLELRSGVSGGTGYDLMLSTAAGEAMRIDASNSNNVGIGKNNPSYKLDVAGEVGIDSYIRHNGDTDTYFGFNGVDSYKRYIAGGDRFIQTSTLAQFNTDTYINGEFSQGVSIANKVFTYGAEFRSSGASIQIVMGRDGAGSGSGAIGADENSIFSAWNVDSGASEKFRIDKSGNLFVNQYIYHDGDTDTAIRFTDDDIQFNAGGLTMLKLTEGTTDEVAVNPDGANLNFRVEGDGDVNLIKTDASNDRVGIGIGSPTQKLHVEGNALVNGNIQVSGSKAHIHFNRPNGSNVGAIGWDDTDNVFYVAGHPDYGPTAGDIVRVYGFGSDVRLGDNTNGDVLTVDASNGNVGIGDTSPDYKLDVVGQGHFESDNASGSLVLSRTTNPDQKLYLRGGNGSGEGWVAAQYQLELRSGVSGGTGYDLLFSTATGEAMRVDASNSNNVGIGTNSPAQKLHVVGNAEIEGSIYANQYIYHNDDTDTFIRFQTNDINLTAGGNNLFRVDGNSSQKTAVVNESGIDLDFRVESDTVTHALFVEGSTGNVGIGTASPGATLTVNGIIEATEKSFNIEHPTKPGKRLIYGVLEGPEHGVYVRGKSTEKVIELPEVWTGLVHQDSLTVQLTCKGKPFQIWVEDIRDNKVYINTDVEEFEFYYYVQGERKDVDKLIIERDAN